MNNTRKPIKIARKMHALGPPNCGGLLLNRYKNMNYKLLLFFLLTSNAYAEPLFYFHVGSSWTYQVEGKKNYQVTNKVIEVKTIDGQNWYKLVEYGEVFWVANKEHGQFEAINFFDKNPSQLQKAEEILVFKYPAEVGETWKNNDSPTTYLGTTNIVVPAGEFTCHMYHIDLGKGDYSKSCIAKHVGVVYNEVKFENNSTEISKLLHYK